MMNTAYFIKKLSAGPTANCWRRPSVPFGHRLEPQGTSRSKDSRRHPTRDTNPSVAFRRALQRGHYASHERGGAREAGGGVQPAQTSAASIYGGRQSSIEPAAATGCRLSLPTCGSLTVIEYDGMNLDVVGNPEIVEVLV